MKKILLILLLIPYFSNAQFVNTILRKNTATKTIYSYSSGTAGNDTLANVYKLDQFAEGQVPSWDATNKRFKAETVALSGISTFVFSRSNSDISGYKQAVGLNSYVEGLRDTATVTATTSATLMQEFATNVGFPNITVIQPGEFNIHYDVKKASGSQNFWTFAVILKRTSGGTETALDTTDISTVTDINTLQQINVSSVIADNIILNATDRLVVKVYARMQSGTASISLYTDDATYARLTIPSASVDASNFVPYVGATKDLNLGIFNAKANKLNLGSITTASANRILSGQELFTLTNANPWYGLNIAVGFKKTDGIPFTSYGIGSVSHAYVDDANTTNWPGDGVRPALAAIWAQADSYPSSVGTIGEITAINSVVSLYGGIRATRASGLNIMSEIGGTAVVDTAYGIRIQPVTIGTVNQAIRTEGTAPSIFGGYVQSSTINGGTAPNDDLTLQGTTNATRTTSYVNLQPNGGNVGIGVATPLQKLHINTGTDQNLFVRPGTDVGGANGVAINTRTDDNSALQELSIRASNINLINSGNVVLSTVPSTSSGTYDGLTRNTSTGAIEKIGLVSGTYTPTLTNGTNVDSSTPTICHYTRVGNEVTVFGSLTVDVTATGTQTDIDISLPIASNFIGVTDAAGSSTPNMSTVANGIGEIKADISNDRVDLSFFSLGTSTMVIRFSFMYTVL